MNNSDLLETIAMCKRRLALSAAFDKMGFFRWAANLAAEVEIVTEEIRASRSGDKLERFAIRGYTDRDEYIRNIMRDMGAGAAVGATGAALGTFGVGTGVGAALGGAIGAAGGAVSGPMQDWWYRSVNGPASRSMALAGDFGKLAQELSTQMAQSGNTQGAATVMQAAQQLHERVRSHFDQLRQQVSQQYGITPDQDSKWYSAWGPKLQRYFRMISSSADHNMKREAAYPSPAGALDDVANAAAKELERGHPVATEMLSGPGWVTDPIVTVPQAMGTASKLGLGAAGGTAARAAVSPWVANPLMLGAYMAGGAAGDYLGRGTGNLLHGGGAAGRGKMILGQMGQIIAEIEKQLQTRLDDIGGAIYTSVEQGLGGQFAGNFGSGYGRQTGNSALQDYFGRMSGR